MSVAVLQAVPFHLENCGRPQPPSELVVVKNDDARPEQYDIWNAIQAQKAAADSYAAEPPAPFVPFPVRRSLSPTSLRICTESLGSENGSDDFFCPSLDAVAADDEEAEREDESPERETEVLCRAPEQSEGNGRLTSVNYHCSGGRRSPPRSYPPPLLSMCRRDGRCLYMRPHRCDGRLVVAAVPVPSQNYLHAQRSHGRLLLSFIDAITSDDPVAGIEQNNELEEKEEEIEAALEEEEPEVEEEEDEDEEEEEEEEEEEVEVVDRGTIVEVKVASMKVLRSSLVINKFVGGEVPPPEYEASALDGDSYPAARRAPATTATAAAAVVVASTLSAAAEACDVDGANGDDGCHQVLDNKLLFTSKRRNRKELLRSMRRCSELRRPWFIWEPCCIAASY